MIVGVVPAMELKEKSIQLSIPFANLLRGYVIEDFLGRMAAFPQEEQLWFADLDLIGVNAYQRLGEGALHFYFYQGEEETAPASRTEELLSRVCGEWPTAQTRGKWKSDVTWQYRQDAMGQGNRWQLEGEYCEMKVPLVLCLIPLAGKGLHPQPEDLTRCLAPEEHISVLTYSSRNQLSAYFFEMMRKLELIGDMGAYHLVNEILKTEAVSGRRIMEEMQKLSRQEPRILREKRIDQLAGYRNYAYMRKRWEQYQKKHPAGEGQPDSWEQAMERLLRFAEPIWRALCRDEVFFDDWMPELGRFLG